MFNQDKAAEIIKILSKAVKYDGNVLISGEETACTRFANSQISQNTQKANISVELNLYNGKRSASCITNVIDEDGLIDLAKKTQEALQAAPEGKYGQFKHELKPVNSVLKEELSAWNAKKRAEGIYGGLKVLTEDQNAAGALMLIRDTMAFGYLGESKSAPLFQSLRRLAFNTVVTDKYSGADGGAQFAGDEPDFSALFANAGKTAKNAANPKELAPGEYTVVLTPTAFDILIAFLIWSLNAKRISDGASFASKEDVGKRLLSEKLSVSDEPILFDLPFDREGVERRALKFIENGVFKNASHDLQTAHEWGVEPTGDAYFSQKGVGGFAMRVTVAPGDSDLDSLIAGVSKGLFINELHYVNFVNPRLFELTGLTRNGFFLIEDGKIGAPVKNLRFTQNMTKAFNNISGLTKEREAVGVEDYPYLVPGARIENFRFTS